MRYLLDLPLCGAVAGVFGLFYLNILLPHPSGNTGEVMAIECSLLTVACWLLLAVVLFGCVGIGGFDWIPASGRFGRLGIVAAGYGGLILLALVAIFLNMGWNDPGDVFGPTVDWAAPVAGLGLPLVLLAYAAWLINAPAPVRDAPGLRYVVLGAVVVLDLLAANVWVRQMTVSAKGSAETAAHQQQFEDTRMQAQWSAFKALTDADSLDSWAVFMGNYYTTEAMRAEATRRMAARPNLEAELAAKLADNNGNVVEQGIQLIARLPFQPTAALEQPVRKAIAGISAGLRDMAGHETYAGDDWIDHQRITMLQSSTVIAERMSHSGVDLRDALDAMQAAVALYPKSRSAHAYPLEVAAAKQRIAKTLAARNN
jgi:hypothetical protein